MLAKLMANIVQNLPFVLLAIALIVLQFFLRRQRGPAANQQEVVINLLQEARLDIKMTEVFDFSPRARTFMTTTWRIHKNGLDFLDHSVQASVSDAFTMADDINRLIGQAQKYKSSSYLAGVDMTKLKSLLVKCQEGLEQWLLLKVGTKNPQPRTPGMFGDLFGRQ